jgi:hypothetical protein
MGTIGRRESEPKTIKGKLLSAESVPNFRGTSD